MEPLVRQVPAADRLFATFDEAQRTWRQHPEACAPCPAHSHSAPGSEVVDHCHCNQGYSRRNISGAECELKQSGHAYPVTLVLDVFMSMDAFTPATQVTFISALAAAAGVLVSDVSILAIARIRFSPGQECT